MHASADIGGGVGRQTEKRQQMGETKRQTGNEKEREGGREMNKQNKQVHCSGIWYAYIIWLLWTLHTASTGNYVYQNLFFLIY